MSVSLSPSNALGFNRPLTQTVKRALTISNHNAQPVAFKVKTTAPKLYCVRPNSGRIEPGESADVSVMLQAMREEPPLSSKCKDKFLIQSTIITADKETMSLHDIWNATGDTEETKIHQHKIRVVYLPPEGQVVEEEDETQAHMGMSSMMSVNDSQRYDTVRQHPATNGHVVEPIHEFSEAPQERAHTPPADSEAHLEQHPETEVPPPSEPMPTSPAPVVTTLDQNSELLAKYNEAQAEILRLRTLLAAMPEPSSPTSNGLSSSDGLRRRNKALSDETSTFAGSFSPETEVGTLMEEGVAPPEGVPLQVVIIIALGVFITTYLFF